MSNPARTAQQTWSGVAVSGLLNGSNLGEPLKRSVRFLRVWNNRSVHSSGAEITDPDILNRLPESYRSLLKNENGFILFNGGLHVRCAVLSPEWIRSGKYGSAILPSTDSFPRS